jgi:hypothetical protein
LGDALEGCEQQAAVLVVGPPLFGKLLAEIGDLVLQTLDQRSSSLALYVRSRLGPVLVQVYVDPVVHPLVFELIALYALPHGLHADAQGLRRLARRHTPSGHGRGLCPVRVAGCPVAVMDTY